MKRSYWKYITVALPYLRGRKRLVILSLTCTAIGSAVAILQPWPLAFLVDSVLEPKHQPPAFVVNLVGRDPSHLILFAVAAGLVVVLVIEGTGLLTQWVNTKLELGIVRDHRSDLFEHSLRLPQAFHDHASSGDFIYRINFEASAAGRVMVAIPPLIQAVLTLTGMFVVTLRIDPLLAWVSLTVVPFIWYSIGYYGNVIEPRLLKVRNLEAGSLTLVNQTFVMIRVIVAFHRQRFEHARFVDITDRAVTGRIAVTVRQTTFSVAVALITAAGTALVLGIGAHHVLRQVLTVGELLVVMSYIAQIYDPLHNISTTIAQFQQDFIALRMCRLLLEEKPDLVDAPHARPLRPIRGNITFEGVTYSYTDRAPALRDISFDVPAGSRVAVVGPTGAGKTTLANLIPRYLDPRKGRILLDGHDLRDLTLESVREGIAFVQQDPLLFGDTSIMENIRYGRLEATDDDVIAAAQAANAHDFVMRFPDGYATEIGERGARLSGGERQRLAIARAFLKDAPILVLDEPTSSIDSKTEAVILDAMESLMSGRTTVMIAHRLSTVRGADHVLVLNDGVLVEHGTHADLIAREGLYRYLAEIQGVVTHDAYPTDSYLYVVPPLVENGDTQTIAVDGHVGRILRRL